MPRRKAWPEAEVETTRKTSPWSSSWSPLSSMSSSSPSWISSSSSRIRRVFVKVGDLKVAASRKEGTCLKRSALSAMLFFVLLFARGVLLLCACAQSWKDTPSREAARPGGGQASGGCSDREENIAVVIIVAAIVVIVLVVTVIAGVVIVDISACLCQSWNPVLGEGTCRQAESKNPVLHAICKGSSHTNFRHRGRTARTL